MSSERFEKDKEGGVGPGSYDLPPALDDHGAVILQGTERFQDVIPETPAHFYIYDDADKAKSQVGKPGRKGGPLTAKENRMPLGTVTQDIVKGSCETMELEQLRRRLATEERARLQAEESTRELATVKLAVENAHTALLAKEQNIKELQRQLEEANAATQEIMASDLEHLEGLRTRWEAQCAKTTKHIAVLIEAQDSAESYIDKQDSELARRGAAHTEAVEKQATLKAKLLKIEAKRAEASDLRAKAEEALRGTSQGLRQKSEEARGLGLQVAELNGRLFVAEQAQSSTLNRAKAAEERESILLEDASRLQGEVVAAFAARQGSEEALTIKQAKIEELQKDLCGLQREATCWQKRCEAAEAAVALHQSQEEELADLKKTNEEQAGQSRELMSTIQVFRRDLETLQAENHRLQDAEASREEDFERDMSRKAELTGHANHRQKIHYMKKLKDTNLELRAELKKAHQRQAQLEIQIHQLRSESLAPIMPCRSATICQSPRQGALSNAARRQTVGGTAADAPSPRKAEASLTTEEACRRYHFKDRELERLRTDYQHLLELLTRASLVSSAANSVTAVLESLRESVAFATSSSHREAASVEVPIRMLQEDFSEHAC